jgi:hypothetical protein|tara:strand:- start:59 stop:1990 length:1932 start_codon:yes stop_codon:yes gene_type:complete
MSRTFTLNNLTEGIRDRHVGQEASRIQEKWTRTGLLRGLEGHNRENMARLMENQAAQVLREANTLGTAGSDAGRVDGFSNIAFPIVRRVFGGLVANELVSIQPMSLPSGLLFYLDYTYGSDVGGDATASNNSLSATGGSTYKQGQSIYNNPAGASVRTGSDATGGQYDLVGTSYSKVHSNKAFASTGDALNGAMGTAATQTFTAAANLGTAGADGKLLQFDPQITKEIDDGTNTYQVLFISASLLQDSANRRVDPTLIKEVALYSENGVAGNGPGNLGTLTVPGAAIQGGNNIWNVRRLNELGTLVHDSAGTVFTPDPFANVASAGTVIKTIVQGTASTMVGISTALNLSASFPVSDALVETGDTDTGSVLVVPSFESDFGTTPTPVIPEIDIKIESIAVTATTRKLRARWSPELAQDLNAYHSMDAEVELTQILSEQIALEIDREILNDLLVQAKGANFFWSRAPGKFVNKRTGAHVSATLGPVFTGTVREWYETLVETIIDVANEIHRKTLRGSANFIVVSPEVATIFEASVLYKPSIKIDGQGQAAFSGIGAEAIGSLSNRFTVYKDPYFPRNKILVGYKGGSYLESGYVYAPYVPLIVTPTIFAPEDFTPRKGVMTRYGKKMVRADFYGTVTCLDMDII